MSIKKIFKDGRAELGRKSSLRKSKRVLEEKEKALNVKLTALGKKARDAKLDISQFGDLSGTLSQIEGKGKEIGAKLDELNKQATGLEEKRKAENIRFDALWKDLETKKKPVDSESKSEKDKLEKAQKEADSIQKRLKNIPDEEEKIRKKITESQGNAQAQAELEKKLTALKEEQKQLDAKLPGLTKIIQAVREKITPLDLQSGRLEAEMKKAKDQRKKEIEDIDKTLSKVKGEINEFNKQQKGVSGQQVQNFQALGKKLSEANVTDPAISAKMEAVKAAEKEMASVRTNIQTLEGQKAPGARGAVWKMAGLILVFLIVIAGIIIGAILISKSTAGKKTPEGQNKSGNSQAGKIVSDKGQGRDAKRAIPSLNNDFLNRELSRDELDRINTKLSQWISNLEGAAKEIPRHTFDPQAIVDSVGKDPQALFLWVRDNTYYVPYQGCLRGPVGVLMDRLGNSLDRSLLLLKLLNLAGYEVQLAHGFLTEEKAKKLLDAVKPVPQGLSIALQKTAKRETAQSGRPDGQTAAEESTLQQEMDAWSENVQQLDQKGIKRVEEITSQLAEGVGKYLSENKIEQEHDLQTLRDHWWVQWKNQKGWENFDMALPDEKHGATLTEAQETCLPQHLQDDLFHVVKIRIIVEQWADGKLKENLVLEHSLRPFELFDQGIVLNQYPMNWPEKISFLNKEEALISLKANVSKEKEWLPYLKIGPKMIFQSSFNDAGDINKSPWKKSPVGGIGGTPRDVFGALGGGESSEISQKKSHLTAEWIEYEITIPGKSARTIRREIFDGIGSAARAVGHIPEPLFNDAMRLARGFCLQAAISILPQVCMFSPQFVNWIFSQQFLAELNVLREQLNKGKIVKTGELAAGILSSMESLQARLYTWVLDRQELSRSRNDIYLEIVNIANVQTRFAEDPEGNLEMPLIFDIVNNDVAVHRQKKSDAVAIRLNQGVADTVAESDQISEFWSQENVIQMFELTKNQDISWKLLRDARDESLREKRYPAIIVSRLKDDLEAGYYVFVPEKPLTVGNNQRLGWWRINPATGESLGVLDTGYHGFVEDLMLRVQRFAEQYGAKGGVYLFKFYDKIMAVGLAKSFHFFLSAVGLKGCTDQEILVMARELFIELRKLM